MSEKIEIDYLDVRMNAMIERAKKRSDEIRIFMETQPQTKPCNNHPEVTRTIDFKRTEKIILDNGGKISAGYSICSSCQAEWDEMDIRAKLHAQGVPSILLHCTLENWNATTTEDQQYVEYSREFSKAKVGFLLLLGAIGTGKSHLAVGIMRLFKSAMFLRQNDLLRRLRRTYRDSNAEDPIERCQKIGLLVLDEAGLSSGGRDELPLLHEILDYRHGERKPTIITGNLEWPELASGIGERLADRLKESAFRILTLAGDSKRTSSRDRYFCRSYDQFR